MLIFIMLSFIMLTLVDFSYYGVLFSILSIDFTVIILFLTIYFNL